jgi:alpha-L-fucosidase 2
MDFLKKYFYLLKEACVFFADFLIPGKEINNAGEPYLIVSPSSSPENSYLLNGDTVCLSTGCQMDNQILRKLFEAAIRSAELLGVKDVRTQEFCSILERIQKPVIHSNGTIREWLEEYEEAEPGHRHFSHLWALWPGDSITLDETPELAQAARNTLTTRLAADGGHTGWSRSWLINFYACLKEGEKCLEHLNALFKDFTLPNFLNSHPPFQIDGNFGSLSGITLMLLQSRIRYNSNRFNVILDILPALPQSWSSGHLKGIRAKGDLELDFAWQDGRLTSLVINNKGTAKVQAIIRMAGSEQRKLVLPPGETSVLL